MIHRVVCEYSHGITPPCHDAIGRLVSQKVTHKCCVLVCMFTSRNKAKLLGCRLLKLHSQMSSFSCPLYSLEEVSSTMDKAREYIVANQSNGMFAVTANHQTKGRGTKGRVWVSAAKNLYLTIAIPLKSIPIPLMLLPLRVGALIVPAIRDLVSEESNVKLKWPNDVLINQHKVCGVLIELEGGYALVGIGCNVESAPTVTSTGANGGRPATCLTAHLPKLAEDTRDNEESSQAFCLRLTQTLLRNFENWLNGEPCRDTEQTVLQECSAMLDYSPQFLRQEYTSRAAPASSAAEDCRGDVYSGLPSRGEEVVPLTLNPDGTLQVRDVVTGSVKTLCAEYIW